MKACVYDQFGPSAVLAFREVPIPEPSENEVQIHIQYAGSNPVDYKIRNGYLAGAVPHKFPIIPGWDGAGVVSKCGKNVRAFHVGDEVFGDLRTDTIQFGTYAEYCLANESYLAHKPKNMSFSVAAALPIVSLTAWEALIDIMHIKAKESILIHAGAGGVGSMAIQFAKMKGLFVLTTAREKNHPYVKKLGADVAIDYTKEDVRKKVLELFPDGVDYVFDCVGEPVLHESLAYIKRGGFLLSIVDRGAEKLASDTLRARFLFAAATGERLAKIAREFEAGRIVAPEIMELPLLEAKKAHEALEGRQVRGKIVLRIS